MHCADETHGPALIQRARHGALVFGRQGRSPAGRQASDAARSACEAEHDASCVAEDATNQNATVCLELRGTFGTDKICTETVPSHTVAVHILCLQIAKG